MGWWHYEGVFKEKSESRHRYIDNSGAYGNTSDGIILDISLMNPVSVESQPILSSIYMAIRIR